MEAKEFKRKRMSLGLTQVELAEILDVKSNTVSRYETGLLNIPKTVELALEALERRQKASDSQDK
jgi:transcriptional regulator with XRE-family HTH domain